MTLFFSFFNRGKSQRERKVTTEADILKHVSHPRVFETRLERHVSPNLKECLKLN